MLKTNKLNLKILFKNIFKMLACLNILIIIICLAGCTNFSFLAVDIKEEDLKSRIKLENSAKDGIFDEQRIQERDIVEKTDSYEEINISEKVRNPFKPFYMKTGELESVSNQLMLKNIYSAEKVYYVEIDVNGSIYKLKKDDQFAKIYQVLSINEDSIVLLKGDELITLYMNEIYYD